MAVRLLETHPALGYVAALVAALPPWVLDMREALGVLGTLIGIAVGVVTLMIQVRTWRTGRRPKHRQ